MFMFLKHKWPHETVAFSAVLLIIQFQMVLKLCQAAADVCFPLVPPRHKLRGVCVRVT